MLIFKWGFPRNLWICSQEGWLAWILHQQRLILNRLHRFGCLLFYSSQSLFFFPPGEVSHQVGFLGLGFWMMVMPFRMSLWVSSVVWMALTFWVSSCMIVANEVASSLRTQPFYMTYYYWTWHCPFKFEVCFCNSYECFWQIELFVQVDLVLPCRVMNWGVFAPIISIIWYQSTGLLPRFSKYPPASNFLNKRDKLLKLKNQILRI